VLRRRVSRLLKENKIWKLKIPGTRFGLSMFCTPDRDYKIIVIRHVTGIRIFYTHEYKNKEGNILLENYWELKGPNWSRWVFSDEPFLVPSYSIRDSGARIWE